MSLNEIIRSEDKDQVIRMLGRTANRCASHFALLAFWTSIPETKPAFQIKVLAHFIREDPSALIAITRLAQATEDLLFGSLAISNEGKPLADELRLQLHDCRAADE